MNTTDLQQRQQALRTTPRPAVAPSILSADFCRLGEEVEAIVTAGADWVHVDVMDGCFVPNITIGPPVVASVRQRTPAPLDVHLMIREPERYAPAFAAAGADILTVHAEACPHLHRNLQQIRALGVCCGVSLNPSTPVVTVEHVLEEVDVVLVMSVNPGFGGQNFLPLVLPKIAQLSQWREQRNLGYRIEVDGGITDATIGSCWEAGADVFVAGSYVFSGDDYTPPIQRLRAACPGKNP